MQLNRFIPVFLLGSALSCISPLDIETEREEKILIVEGYISTLPGPYTIRITTSARYGSVFDGVIKPEPGADVWIKDDLGTLTFLKDEDYGIYRTPVEFKGEVGRSYVLNIETAVGDLYSSLPEKIQSVPKVDSVFYEFRKLPTVDPLEFVSGVEVYVAWQDPPDETNFHIWRNSGIFFIKTFPENYVIPGPFPQVSAPKDCCNECWVSERNADYSIYVHKDSNTNGMINTQLVGFIEDDGLRFTDRYQISIQQLSISKEAYQFFSLLRSQKSIDGDIFDPPPATIRGNMIKIDDPESNVIGYFHASDGYQINGFIERSVIEEYQRARKINNDCRVLRGATATKPDDWN